MAKKRTYEFFDEAFLARLERLHLIAKRMAARGPSGPRRSRRLGDGLEFADHRAYAPGDDIRFIDWPYYARMERLLLRLFHEHSESDVAILFDASASMAPGGVMEKFDYARRAAAALAYVAMGSGQRAVLLPFAERLGPPERTGRNRAQVLDVLDYLAGVVPAGRTQLRRCVETFCRQCESAGTVLLVSDLLDCRDDMPDALGLLGQKNCDVIVLHLFSRSEAVPSLRGPMLLDQAETAQRMSVNVTDEVLANYRRCWQRFRTGCERACLSRGATYIAAPTDVPFERLVLMSLKKAGVIAG